MTRALCLVQDPNLKRTLRRTLASACTSIEFCDDLEHRNGSPVDIVFVDTHSRTKAQPGSIEQLLAAGGRVVLLGDSLEDDDVVSTLRSEPLDHVITDAAGLDEAELVITSVKLATGDIFGVEKYLSWGATIHEHQIADYEDKRASLLSIGRFAESTGARRPVISKIESATDELLMNAIYDAPAIHMGQEPAPKRLGRGTLPTNTKRFATLKYGCDGRYFAVAVRDGFGALDKRSILDSVLRARQNRGRPKEEGGGAGLGLYMVLSSATRFIVNIQPGKTTEVICLFDLRQRGRESDGCAKSLHVFTAIT